MLPHLLWFELGIEDGQLSEHSHVSTFEPESRLQHGDQLLEIATVLKAKLHKHSESTILLEHLEKEL